MSDTLLWKDVVTGCLVRGWHKCTHLVDSLQFPDLKRWYSSSIAVSDVPSREIKSTRVVGTAKLLIEPSRERTA